MDIYDSLSLKIVPGKSEPDVWVRRIVIYRQVSPQPIQVREIELTRGVNIVWAEETDDESDSADITGHSAGKTSFCRLFRYVLGEKTFGTKANTELIQKAFPAGYVGAEMFVKQKRWAVIRPIGNGRNSYIKADAMIEEVIQDRSNSTNQDDYPVKLGLDALLDHLETGAVLRTNKAIQWGHLLAWCTRDQEARFQNCYDWRSPRSDSEWPSFRSSKTDPLFVMRTVLGLFLPDELKGEEELAELMQAQEELEKKIPLLRQEPQFRVNLYDRDLRRRLRELLPDTPDIETLPLRQNDLFAPNLDKLIEDVGKQVVSAIKDDVDEKDRLQIQIEAIGGRIAVLQSRQEQLNILFSVDDAGQREIDQGVAQRQNERQLFDRASESSCILGGVLYRNCPLVQERQTALKIVNAQDAQSLQMAAIAKAEAQKTLDQQRKQLQDQIAALQKQAEGFKEKRKPLEATIQSKREAAHDLTFSHKQLSDWTELSSKPGEFKELDDSHEQLKTTIKKIEKLKIQLNDLLVQHDENRKLMSSIFSAAVRGVLPSGAYDGRVSLADRELAFGLTHGTAMSGEAVETLAVLLADLACMVFNSVSVRSHLPGFLLHDSPREADLSLRLYRRFISLGASLQNHFGSPGDCPFQYIITTTTPPPEGLKDQKWVKLHLNAAIPAESLFRCNIATEAEGMVLDSGLTS